MDVTRKYRRVAVGADVPDAVTVGIESRDSAIGAAVWWPSHGDVDADEAEYDSVEAAFEAAEAARALHGFREVVVTMTDRSLWQPAWGELAGDEPMGDLRGTDVTEDEAYELAAGIEAERDA